MVNGSTVSFAAFLLGGGALADRFGSLRVFRWGVASFGVLSLVAARGSRLPVVTGLAVLTAGALVLAAATHAPYPVLACGLLLLGIGVSLSLPALAAGVAAAAQAVSFCQRNSNSSAHL
ncbi:hypothetical protein GCM10027445_28590 [Amycolatopsis endophytica]